MSGQPEDGTFTLPVIESAPMPPGTFLLAPAGHMEWRGLVIRPDPWGPPPPSMPDYVKAERRKGLDHLAGLLDGMCSDLGMDPDVVWRNPRQTRMIRRDFYRVVAEERYGMMVLPPTSFMQVDAP